MGEGVVIRAASVDDAGHLAVMNAIVQEAHWRAHPERFVPPDPVGTMPTFAAWLADETRRLWIAEVDDEAVGYAAASRRQVASDGFRRDLEWIQLDHLAVHPRARRSGIGGRLLEAATQWAAGSGGLRIELSVGEFNEDARAFFAAAGFVALSHVLVRDAN